MFIYKLPSQLVQKYNVDFFSGQQILAADFWVWTWQFVYEFRRTDENVSVKCEIISYSYPCNSLSRNGFNS